MNRPIGATLKLLLASGMVLGPGCGFSGVGAGTAPQQGAADGDSGGGSPNLDGASGEGLEGDSASGGDGSHVVDADGATSADGTPSDGVPDEGAIDGSSNADAAIDGQDGAATTCGNGKCEAGEQCPVDCKAACGDLVCGGDETYATCAVDCGTLFKAFQSCGLQSCYGAWTSCLADAGCVGFYNCVLNCKDEGCYENCVDATPDAASVLADTLDACMEDKCDVDYQPPCGDSLCEVGESTADCPKDCPAVCGDQSCDPPETATSCKVDCDNCGDGSCDSNEDKQTCPVDCDPCGDGLCDAGETLSNCPADCGNCGDGTCDFGETKAGCPADCDTCGNGVCNPSESPATCPGDCAAVCGDGLCTQGEGLDTCDKDCKVCGDKVCSEGESSANCSKDCPPCPKCKVGEVCVPSLGQCVTPKCQLPTQWANVQKIASLALTKPQDACDLTGDGVGDNAFYALEPFSSFEKMFSEVLATGKIAPMFEAIPFLTNGSGFLLRALDGTPAAPGCNLLSPTANCAYHVYAVSYDLLSGAVACPALREAQGSKIAKGALSATFNFLSVPMPLGVGAGPPAGLPLQDVLVVGSVDGATTWQTTTGGKICGVLTPKALDAWLNAIPADVLAGMGIDAGTFKTLFKAMLKPDIDTDGDTADDAWSVSFSFTTVPATITGLAY